MDRIGTRYRGDRSIDRSINNGVQLACSIVVLDTDRVEIIKEEPNQVKATNLCVGLGVQLAVVMVMRQPSSRGGGGVEADGGDAKVGGQHVVV